MSTRIKSWSAAAEIRAMEAPIYLPAPLVVTPQALPWCCTRHGQPAVKWKKAMFSSRPPLWVYLTLCLGLLPLILVLVALRRQLKAPAWPFCRTCLRTRRQRLLMALAGGMVWFCSFMTVCLVSDTDTVAWALGLISAVFVTPFLMLALSSAASWQSMAAGVVTRDGAWLMLSKPSPVFVAALPPMSFGCVTGDS